MLYEDELADNGIAMLSCKIRVMPARMLLLSRFFMRLDNVIFRIRDTRIYVDFGTGEVIREYVAKEDEFESVRKVRCLLLRSVTRLTAAVEACYNSRRRARPDARCQ
jgi:type 2A phosphatase activator TIP41